MNEGFRCPHLHFDSHPRSWKRRKGLWMALITIRQAVLSLETLSFAQQFSLHTAQRNIDALSFIPFGSSKTIV